MTRGGFWDSLQPSMKGIAPTVGWVIVALALLVSFGVDFANMTQGGAIDLRNRITGARVLAAHLDPYHYKWHEPEPAEYCDPFNNPNLPVSKVTATPAFLVLHLPLAVLPYGRAQEAWFFAQWLLLLGTGWLWLRACATLGQRLLLAAFVAGFSYTDAWRLHAERGQVYVLLAFLFAAWLTMTRDGQKEFAAGLLAGGLITLRPTFVLLAPFVMRRRGQWLGVVVGLLVGLILPMVWRGGAWTDYFSAMRAHSYFYRTDFNPHYQQAYPPQIEGIDTDALARFAPIPFADYSVHALLKWLGAEPFPGGLVLLALAAPFGVWLWLARDRDPVALLPCVAAWFFLADLFLPAFRNTYNDVLILDVVGAGLATARAIPWGFWPCAAALPVGWLVYGTTADQPWLIDLPSFLFSIGALLFLYPAARPTSVKR